MGKFNAQFLATRQFISPTQAPWLSAASEGLQNRKKYNTSNIYTSLKGASRAKFSACVCAQLSRGWVGTRACKGVLEAVEPKGRSQEGRLVGFSKSAIRTRYGENAENAEGPSRPAKTRVSGNPKEQNAENAEDANKKARKMWKMRLIGFNVTGFRWPPLKSVEPKVWFAGVLLQPVLLS